MEISITFTDVSVEEVKTLINALDGACKSTNEKIDTKIKEEQTKAKTKKKRKSSKKPEPEPDEDFDDDDDEISLDDVKTALKQYAKSFSKEDAKKILNEFASSTKKLKKSQYAELIARLVEEMEEDE